MYASYAETAKRKPKAKPKPPPAWRPGMKLRGGLPKPKTKRKGLSKAQLLVKFKSINAQKKSKNDK